MKVLDTGIEVEPLAEVPAGLRIPEQYRGRKADALQVPLGYMGITNERIRAAVLDARFGGALEGVGSLEVRSPHAGYAFITRDARDLLYFPKTDPYTPGQPRYDWYQDSEDGGVIYGFLRVKQENK
jgi:hypothetical protein